MNQKVFKRRVYITGLLFTVLSLAFIVRLFNLHFSNKVIVSNENGTEYHRGYIRDRNGFILAISIEKNSLFANPEEIQNPEETARIVSKLLQIPPETIRGKFNKKKRFIWIKRKIDDAVADEIRKIDMPGLYLKKEYKRVYPHEGLASNIVGFVGIDNNGLAGIEYSFDDTLSARDAMAVPFFTGKNFGRSITLTIDRFIQHSAEKEIEKAVALYRAKQGTVLVLEVKTGRILAMAKTPGFNPNRYYEYPPFTLRNFSFIDSFEPGSTMKMISLSSILENNPAMANNRYTCSGWIDISDARINCTGVHGTIGMDDIIRYSCNVGVIQAVKGIKKTNLYDTLTKFRFGMKTGIELPGETEGILRGWNKWSGLSKFSIAIGQEISVTALQLAAAFSAIGNGGVYIAPSIIESIEDHDGKVVRTFRPAAGKRIISKKISEKLIHLMRGVVVSGTGQRAGSAYYCVAGKTGTSQKFIKARGYSDRVLASFIGLAPCEDPAVCILVVIDDPADKLSGGQIATPVFAGLIDKVLFRLGVKKQRLKTRDPIHRSNRQARFDGKTMPDFNGLRISESLSALIEMKKQYHIQYSINGTGTVYSQQPAPGARLEQAMELQLYLKE
jgi:cell division protein FtsI/penicillin-binding protein 2